jgi:hypothetical protein
MLSEHQLEAIRACNDCLTACMLCATACLEEDATGMARCISLDLECAELCRLTASAIARNSEHMDAICALCAHACDTSSDECDKHNMDHCQRCAEASRYCAETCRHIMFNRAIAQRLHA